MPSLLNSYEFTNIDIIKRLSQLEKMVYGSKDSKKDEE